MSIERLSADLQFFRQGVPTLLVIFAAVILLAIFYGPGGVEAGSMAAAVLVVAALSVGLLLVRRTAAQLAEEVDLIDDALIVRRRGVEQRIPLAQIVDVHRDLLLRPGITLVLREAGPLGDRIRFLPSNAYRAANWGRNRIARRLDALVDRARLKESAR